MLLSLSCCLNKEAVCSFFVFSNFSILFPKKRSPAIPMHVAMAAIAVMMPAVNVRFLDQLNHEYKSKAVVLKLKLKKARPSLLTSPFYFVQQTVIMRKRFARNNIGSLGRTRTYDMLVTLDPSLSRRSGLYHDPTGVGPEALPRRQIIGRVLPFGIVSEPFRRNA